MIYSNKKVVQILGEIFQKKLIFNIIISPGSRNAPIIIHFTQNKIFNTYSIIDERCAGFFALGMAQKLKQPVVINCTSGSSVVNYYPSITEAFYQKIPIIIVTADRPNKKINILEGQTIHQENIFKNHVVSFSQLTEDESKIGIWYNNNLINESINKCILTSQPVHINIPFSEPLYEITNSLQVEIKNIKIFPTKKYIKKHLFYKEKKIWNNCKKKMILLGLNNYYNNIKKLKQILEKICLDPSIIIFSESTSHINGDMFFSNIDQIFYSMDLKKWKKFKPTILITFGINIISKRIRSFLRNSPPKYHWHIGDNYEKYPDTYYKLNTYWSIDPELFFKIIINDNFIYSNYRKSWINFIKVKMNKQEKFLKNENKFSDLKVIFFIFSKIPKNSILHLGNSMIIRYYQFFNKKKTISYCNRGTSGIEGSVSTAIGYSILSKKTVTLIIGDISFFYDSNALWNNYTPNNFRIILINNGKGNIFDIVSNKKFSSKTNNFFKTKHTLSAKNICKMYNWNYINVCDQKNLEKNLIFFWKKTNNPFLLEINTKKCNNTNIFKKFLYYTSK
ncbi:2-succinyl-5-enolpyruvyl-6-hydroxy-3-cyclohexene-1-carboxylic-acid synthase [Blattabacterium cuenoti]|uniref:2-succinyl-5-enolpyruvyl-6-hydroxy-3- cyclohexene-1-carboxylic-acid synthase n=1 Tax=Blattabacterium cuenoti TaxID=1653831 RepID=UPI001EE9D497|nr:2-succinyl-5-enolpyruvyl-6-hydroxy-3-cyclohexene-1-carboxylic-acid synthase [Blattabacterium cuenoti]